MTTAAISVHGLSKRFGDRVAVDGLTLEVPRGVVAGFVGPNGAGKTTTMAMLLGLVAPTVGTGAVLGRPLDDPARYLGGVGALIEGPALWPGLTGVENLRVLAELGGHDAARIPVVLDTVRLGARGGDRLRLLLVRHEAAARDRRRPAGRPGAPCAGRAQQRPRPRGHR